MTVATVAIVLGVAWYAGREKLELGIAVAILGLSLTYARGLIAIPAALLMAAAALYVPGVVAVMVMAGVVVILVSLDADSSHSGSWW